MKSKSFARSFKRSVNGNSCGVAASENKQSDIKDDRFGRCCRRFLDILTDIVCWIVKVLADILVIIMIACGGIPLSVVVISNLIGVGSDSVITDIVFVFGLPALFVTLLWAVFAVRFLARVNARIGAGFVRIKQIGKDKKKD